MNSDTRFEEIDRQIEVLDARLLICRRSMAVSRAAIWIGGAVLVTVLTLLGSYRTPPVVLSAITAILGGTVWLGANKTSREDVERLLADAEDQKAKLFDEVAAYNGWRDMTPTVH